jgi:hypothetical protein
MGLSAYEQVALQSEFDRHGIHVAPNMGVVMLGPLIICYGTEAQKREILPRILSGEVRWCQGYSEPSAGSDLANLRTTAVLDGDDFIVDGQKIWTSFAHEADMIFMLVRTDPKAKKQDGISFLLADMKSPGITVQAGSSNLTGSAEFCEVFFDDAARAACQSRRAGHEPGLDDGQVAARLRAHHDRQPRAARVRRCCGCANWRAPTGWTTTPPGAPATTNCGSTSTTSTRCSCAASTCCARGRDLGPEVSMLKIWGHRDAAARGRPDARDRRRERPSATSRWPWPAARCTRPTSSSRRGRPASTAAATRSSATSWPRACLNCRADSAWGPCAR